MTKVDYIIVGFGLAGLAFCETLRRHGKQFVVFDDHSQQSSIVAGGLYNPVILKRFTAPWKSHELLKGLRLFYSELEQYLDTRILQETPIYRIFNSVEEQNNWFSASDKRAVSEFLSDNILTNDNTQVIADFGLGQVFQTGRINTADVLSEYTGILSTKNIFRNEQFNYEDLTITDERVKYHDVEANHIVFTDGFGLKKNPFFNYLPLQGSKGEYLMIKSTDLKLSVILKGPIFIIPIKDDTYLVGATYDNFNKTNDTTEKAKEELVSKLNKMIRCDFEIIDQVAGIRPTVKDRRPLVGTHPMQKRLSLINGLGTRGVLASPYLAQQLYAHLEEGDALDAEINVKRFVSLFPS